MKPPHIRSVAKLRKCMYFIHVEIPSPGRKVESSEFSEKKQASFSQKWATDPFLTTEHQTAPPHVDNMDLDAERQALPHSLAQAHWGGLLGSPHDS